MLLKVLLICVWVVVHGQGLDNNEADFTELQAHLQADIDLIIKPEIQPNQRYSVSYDTTDEHGTRLFHTEIIDKTNARLGTYGYINGEGLFRIVYYIANSTGYHVFVCTNEPGTETSDPADAKIRVHKQWKLATSAKVNMLFTRVKTAPEIVKKHMDGERMDNVDMIKKVVFEMMPSAVTSGGVRSRDNIVPDRKGKDERKETRLPDDIEDTTDKTSESVHKVVPAVVDRPMVDDIGKTIDTISTESSYKPLFKTVTVASEVRTITTPMPVLFHSTTSHSVPEHVTDGSGSIPERDKPCTCTHPFSEIPTTTRKPPVEGAAITSDADLSSTAPTVPLHKAATTQPEPTDSVILTSLHEAHDAVSAYDDEGTTETHTKAIDSEQTTTESSTPSGHDSTATTELPREDTRPRLPSRNVTAPCESSTTLERKHEGGTVTSHPDVPTLPVHDVVGSGSRTTTEPGTTEEEYDHTTDGSLVHPPTEPFRDRGATEHFDDHTTLTTEPTFHDVEDITHSEMIATTDAGHVETTTALDHTTKVDEPERGRTTVDSKFHTSTEPFPEHGTTEHLDDSSKRTTEATLYGTEVTTRSSAVQTGTFGDHLTTTSEQHILTDEPSGSDSTTTSAPDLTGKLIEPEYGHTEATVEGALSSSESLNDSRHSTTAAPHLADAEYTAFPESRVEYESSTVPSRMYATFEPSLHDRHGMDEPLVAPATNKTSLDRQPAVSDSGDVVFPDRYSYRRVESIDRGDSTANVTQHDIDDTKPHAGRTATVESLFHYFKITISDAKSCKQGRRSCSTS